MEKILETSPKTPTIQTENSIRDQNTPPPNQKSQTRICNSGKTGTPDRLNVPKAFKYPEKYTSPTDRLMSPVTRVLLARSRKGSKILPPSTNQHKIQALKLQDDRSFQS
ncbi:hydroxyproline-rich glycoprotein family protein [Abeliophyllum distichum]|uniref:Hydroxyproline-rich glycoprotein family protein n=1 Tax=Abeliophyllum distichum TaxID=126358 RepID=A0ABD1SGS9_9LAMI